MKKRSLFTAWTLGISMIASVIWMVWLLNKRADRVGGARVPVEQSDDVRVRARGRGSGGVDVHPAGDGKSKERLSPEESAKLRYERQRRELVEKIDEMKTKGLGHGHPKVRSHVLALEKLDAEQGARRD